MIPLISGATTGPIGLTHLPRLWLKMRLRALGLLPAGYRCGDGGSDHALLSRFGIDLATLVAFVAADVPDYLAYERWVRANSTGLTPEAVAAFNADLVPERMPEPRRTEWCERFGLDGSYAFAVGLNQLDDWALVHAQVVAADAPASYVVPAVSSSVSGPLGAQHLPRFWLKLLLAQHHRLPEGYWHGTGRFDELTMTTLGIDRDALLAFVAAESPGYLTFEHWVRTNGTRLRPEAIAELNATLNASIMPEAVATGRRAQLGVDDPTFDRGIPLNDLDDWRQLHEQLRAA
jgi:hypothetical protein